MHPGLADAGEENILQEANLLAALAARYKLTRIDRRARHDRRDGMLVNQLRLAIAAQQDREIVEPGDNPLQLDALDEEHRHWGLVLAQQVEKLVLQALALGAAGHRFGFEGSGRLGTG